MNRSAALTPRSDLHRTMPVSVAGRLDEAHAALASLRREERRLERLGLAEAVRRCRAQRRYWEFLAALFSLPGAAPGHLRGNH